MSARPAPRRSLRPAPRPHRPTRVASVTLLLACAVAAAAAGHGFARADTRSDGAAAPAVPPAADTVLAERRAKLAAAESAAAQETSAEARAAVLRALAGEHYTLGVWARDRALPEAAREEFLRAVALDRDHEPARDALGDVRLGDRWIPRDEAMAAKGLVQRDGRWILREEADALDRPAAEKALRQEQHGKVRKLLDAYAGGSPAARKFAAEALATVDDRYKLEPFAYALRSQSRDVRLLAAAELGRLADRRALKPLLHRALRDDDADVRTAVVAAAKQIGDANLAAPFVRALGSSSESARMRAAEALAVVGDARAVRYLVWRMEAYGGGGPRAYSFFGAQLSYIQDFDVEVAQTAFIADPQVGTLQEGIVLDAQVHGLQRERVWVEREVVHFALSRLTGASDVPNREGAWAAWWKEHGEDFERTALAASAR